MDRVGGQSSIMIRWEGLCRDTGDRGWKRGKERRKKKRAETEDKREG